MSADRGPAPQDFLPRAWQELSPALDRLLEAEPAARANLLVEITGADTEQRHALERLLAECEQGMPLLDAPAVERFADLAHDDAPALDGVPAILGDRYRIERELGAGGMARVYLAQDQRYNRSVAVKVIRPELAEALGRGRFLREIDMVARLRHPNIMPLFDSGESDGILYYVMPHEPGASLNTRLKQTPPLSLGEALGILRDVARAMVYAHSQGVVHRDIKPANVMLSGGAAVVTDFGISKAFTESPSTDADGHSTRTGAILGTPAYMSPEQAVGNPHIDHRADLYAFGCLAFSVLTGSGPFTGAPHEVIAAHVGSPPPSLSTRRSDVPASVVRLVEQCLRKSPDERPADAKQLLEVLETPVSAGWRPAPRSGMYAASLAAVALASWLVLRPKAGSVAMGEALPVAVLPFTNSERSPSIDYFTSALPQHVVDRLGTGPNVLPFESSADLASYSDSVQRASLATAGVKSMVLGDVRTTGDSVVAEARVVDVASGQQMFRVRAASMTLDFSGLVAQLTDSLRRQLRIGGEDLRPVHIPNPEAKRLVLEADHWAGQGRGPDRQEQYQRATKIDPEWYQPYIGLHDVIGPRMAATAGSNPDLRRYAELAKYYADEALKRAGRDTKARSAALIRRALSNHMLGDTIASGVDARLAARLDTTSAFTQRLIGAWWRWNANLDSAWKYKMRALKLTPWNSDELESVAAIYKCARDSVSERLLLSQAVALGVQEAQQRGYAEVLARFGQWDEAHAMWERSVGPDLAKRVAQRTGNLTGAARWTASRREQGRIDLANLRARAEPRIHYMPWLSAFERSEQRDSAIKVLSEWIESGGQRVTMQVFCNHPFSSFIRDPRVQRIVRASSWPLAEFDTARVWKLPPATR